MKRVGLITFCNHELKVNYGQVLQMYALYTYLTSCGHIVKVINYRPTYIDEGGLSFKLFGRTFGYQEWYKKKKEKKLYTKRNKKFYKFVRYKINITKPCYTEKDVIRELEDCDVFMAGSDQIWNIEAFNKIRLLGIDKNIKRISYGSSGLFEESEEAEAEYRRMAKYWEDIDNISVREESGKRIIERYIDREVEVVADPVFLLEPKYWKCEHRTITEPYMLCYFLSGSKVYRHIIKHIAKKNDIKRIIFVDAENYENHKGLGDIKKDVGPMEFVELIAHAELVCTDSFHGTMFSLIFQRQFFLMKRNEKYKNTFSNVERFRMMFEQWGLRDRIIKNIKEYEDIVDIDYKMLYEKINSHIDKSKKYLERVLGGEDVS